MKRGVKTCILFVVTFMLYLRFLLQPQIQDVRSTTRTEKRRRAMAMRAKELQQLGMKVHVCSSFI